MFFVLLQQKLKHLIKYQLLFGDEEKIILSNFNQGKQSDLCLFTCCWIEEYQTGLSKGRHWTQSYLLEAAGAGEAAKEGSEGGRDVSVRARRRAQHLSRLSLSQAVWRHTQHLSLHRRMRWDAKSFLASKSDEFRSLHLGFFTQSGEAHLVLPLSHSWGTKTLLSQQNCPKMRGRNFWMQSMHAIKNQLLLSRSRRAQRCSGAAPETTLNLALLGGKNTHLVRCFIYSVNDLRPLSRWNWDKYCTVRWGISVSYLCVLNECLFFCLKEVRVISC
jgi:hypothetical protein